MIQGIINAENENEAEVVILQAGYEKTASSRKGTAQGPAKVIEMLDTQIEFFSRKFKKNVTDFVRTTRKNLGGLEKLSPEETLKIISESYTELLIKGKFVFLLGGEHSVSIGAFEALAKKYNPNEVTILQIDAHCDLRKDDSDYNENPSPLAHSTVMRHASELGYNLVQVGIRTYSKDEYEYFNNPKNKITVFEWGLEQVQVEKILDAIKTKYLYITVDVDGFDPAYMPGTGTPVPGGLAWHYGVELLEKATEKCELIGADIVEVSPQSETVLTEYAAAELCYRIIAEKFKNRLIEG